MFAATNLGFMSLGFPDVASSASSLCPRSTFRSSFTNIPSVFNVLFGGGLSENLITIDPLSAGDAGVGVVSGMCMSIKRAFIGSFTVMTSCMFTSRLTSITGQNGILPNAPGMTLVPTQFIVIHLS